MANPLQMLKLKPTALQFIEEVAINAAPKKVWATTAKPGSWFFFNPDKATHSKHSFELKVGGMWTAANPNGSSGLMGTVSYIEPGKLLRISGPLGLTHVPTTNVLIFELVPSADGKKTTLRVGTRMFGFLDKDVKKRFGDAWKMLLGQLKAAAEG